jgi:hypothetical protein
MEYQAILFYFGVFNLDNIPKEDIAVGQKVIQEFIDEITPDIVQSVLEYMHSIWAKTREIIENKKVWETHVMLHTNGWLYLIDKFKALDEDGANTWTYIRYGKPIQSTCWKALVVQYISSPYLQTEINMWRAYCDSAINSLSSSYTLS